LKPEGDDFDAYLAEEIGVDRKTFPQPGEWAGAGETFGAIALKLNLITMTTIDALIEAQQAEELRFGELAVKLGVLTREQADHVLDIQHFHRSLETGERLVVQGKIALPKLLRILADYLEENKQVSP
jgi:hypothetical protein